MEYQKKSGRKKIGKKGETEILEIQRGKRTKNNRDTRMGKKKKKRRGKLRFRAENQQKNGRNPTILRE